MLSYDSSRNVFTHTRYGDTPFSEIIENFLKFPNISLQSEVKYTIEKIRKAEFDDKLCCLSEIEFYETVRWCAGKLGDGIESYENAFIAVLYLLGKHYSFVELRRAINSDTSVNTHRNLFNAETITNVFLTNGVGSYVIRHLLILGFKLSSPFFVYALYTKMLIRIKLNVFLPPDRVFAMYNRVSHYATMAFACGIKPDYLFRIKHCLSRDNITATKYSTTVFRWLDIKQFPCAEEPTQYHQRGTYNMCIFCASYVRARGEYNLFLAKTTLFDLLSSNIELHQ
jgi:hypothetical protein